MNVDAGQLSSGGRHLACRRAGASSPAEMASNEEVYGVPTVQPGRQDARPLRQAGMPDATSIAEHAELLILPNGQVLAHNITPEIAAILSELDPQNEPMARRAVKQLSPKQENETAAGN